MNLLEKLKAYQDAAEVKKFRDKVLKAQEAGKIVKANGPRAGIIPEDYLNLTPLKEAAIKKSVLTSIPVDTYALGCQYSKALLDYPNKPIVMSPRGFETLLITGAQLDRLDKMEAASVTKNIYIAVTAYIINAKEFAFAKNTKRALKVNIDVDGYVSEKVLWPDYNSGELIYPKELKKGSIATLFLTKREGKQDMAISGVVIETCLKEPPESKEENETSP